MIIIIIIFLFFSKGLLLHNRSRLKVRWFHTAVLPWHPRKADSESTLEVSKKDIKVMGWAFWMGDSE